jgi:hypothetical protein
VHVVRVRDWAGVQTLGATRMVLLSVTLAAAPVVGLVGAISRSKRGYNLVSVFSLVFRLFRHRSGHVKVLDELYHGRFSGRGLFQSRAK